MFEYVPALYGCKGTVLKGFMSILMKDVTDGLRASREGICLTFPVPYFLAASKSPSMTR